MTVSFIVPGNAEQPCVSWNRLLILTTFFDRTTIVKRKNSGKAAVADSFYCHYNHY